MSFLDYILAGFGVFEVKDKPFEKENNVVFEKKRKITPSTKENIQDFEALSTNSSFYQSKMAIFKPSSLKQMVDVAHFLSSNQPAMLDVSNIPKNVLQRCMDFVFGVTTVLNTNIKRFDKNVFVLVPKEVEFVEDFEEI